MIKSILASPSSFPGVGGGIPASHQHAASAEGSLDVKGEYDSRAVALWGWRTRRSLEEMEDRLGGAEPDRWRL